MSDSVLDPLRALVARFKQEEAQAEAGLRAALGSHEAATRQHARQRALLAAARDALARANADSSATGPVVAARLIDAARFASRRRDEIACARDALARSEHELRQQAEAVATARAALADIKGRRAAIETRIAARLAERQRAAELRVEEESADAAAARVHRPRRLRPDRV